MGLDSPRFVSRPLAGCVSIEEKSVTIDALLARTNAGTLDEAIHGLERRRKVHVMGGAEPLIRLIRDAWDLHRGKPPSGELAMFANWDELKAAAEGEKDGAPGDPALQVLVRLIQEREHKVLHMCRQLEACVETPAAAQITVSTVHKAKGLEWPRVLMSSDFNHSSSVRTANRLSTWKRLTSLSDCGPRGTTPTYGEQSIRARGRDGSAASGRDSMQTLVSSDRFG